MKFIKSIWTYFFHHCHWYYKPVVLPEDNDGIGIYECEICKRRIYFGGW